MSKNAYTYELLPNSFDSHQTCPATMITVLRWNVRDTFNYGGDPMAIRTPPLVIINDVIAVTTANNKQTPTPAMTAFLKATDVNYATAMAPGDFVFVNMVSDETKIFKDGDNTTLYARAIALKPINKYKDGFKGLFKVQTCRKTLMTDPQTGTKTIGYKLVAYGFTEFNQTVYYNPTIYSQFAGKYVAFMQEFVNFWASMVKDQGNWNVQTLLKMLIGSFIGKDVKLSNGKIPNPGKQFFKIPSGVGRLLGITGAKYASDIYNFILGAWDTTSIGNQLLLPQKGFNPGIKLEGGSYYKTPNKLDGNRVLNADFWNNVKVWAILQSYANITINEMVSTYRVNPNGYIMPTLIIRQKPFTSLHFKGGGITSRFLRMPRWKISPNLVYDMDLGKDEAARINFVQIFTRSLAMNDDKSRAMQTGLQNFVIDEKDVVRNGLKPFVTTAAFDFPNPGQSDELKGKKWAKLVADWLFDGHLRESGTLNCYGIEDPISIGDNLEFDGIVYHIEGTADSIQINKDGFKQFRTNLTLSFGTDDRSTTSQPVYPDMQYSSMEKETTQDYNNEKLLPGIGESQDTKGRVSGEESKPAGNKSFTPTNKEREKPTQNTDGTTKKLSK